jgi:hypothetical protein
MDPVSVDFWLTKPFSSFATFVSGVGKIPLLDEEY